jgi:hypothetical protein
MQSIDLHRSSQQLLEELRVASSRAIEDRNPAHMTVTFAVLLVKLSEQADYATRRLVRLTWVLFWLIVVLMIVVLPPLVEELYTLLSSVLIGLRGYIS